MYYTKQEIEKFKIKPKELKVKVPFANRHLYLMDEVDRLALKNLGVDEFGRQKRHIMSAKDSFDMLRWLPYREIAKYLTLSRQRFYKLAEKTTTFKFAGVKLYDKLWVRDILLARLEEIKTGLYKELNYNTFDDWFNSMNDALSIKKTCHVTCCGHDMEIENIWIICPNCKEVVSWKM